MKTEGSFSKDLFFDPISSLILLLPKLLGAVDSLWELRSMCFWSGSSWWEKQQIVACQRGYFLWNHFILPSLSNCKFGMRIEQKVGDFGKGLITLRPSCYHFPPPIVQGHQQLSRKFEALCMSRRLVKTCKKLLLLVRACLETLASPGWESWVCFHHRSTINWWKNWHPVVRK